MSANKTMNNAQDASRNTLRNVASALHVVPLMVGAWLLEKATSNQYVLKYWSDKTLQSGFGAFGSKGSGGVIRFIGQIDPSTLNRPEQITNVVSEVTQDVAGFWLYVGTKMVGWVSATVGSVGTIVGDGVKSVITVEALNTSGPVNDWSVHFSAANYVMQAVTNVPQELLGTLVIAVTLGGLALMNKDRISKALNFVTDEFGNLSQKLRRDIPIRFLRVLNQ